MTASSEADGRLTPDAIWSYPFPSARLGKRGLEEAPVWEFCRLAERGVLDLGSVVTGLFGLPAAFTEHLGREGMNVFE